MSGTSTEEGHGRDAWRAILAAHDKAGSLLALAAADEALAALPDDPEFLAARGRQLTLLKRFEEAEACLRHALEVAPGHDTAMLHLAQLFVTLGRYEEACNLIEAAIAAGGHKDLTLIRSGRLMLAMARYAEAAGLLDQAIARTSDSSLLAHCEAARIGLAEDAKAGASPGDKAALQSAREQLRLGRPDRAEPLFAALTRAASGFAQGWIGLRGAQEAQGRGAETDALRSAWARAAPGSAAAVEVGTRRRLGGRGLVFDPRDPVPIRDLAEVTRPARDGAELLAGGDACLVIDPGGNEVIRQPVISLDGEGRDLVTVSYRTAPRRLVSLHNAALVGEGVVLNQAGELIAELIPPSRPSKYAGVRDGGWMRLDPLQFRDGMGAVRIFERPTLLMCGPTDASFGDWIINFPPRLALAEAAGLDDLAVVLRRPPQGQALDMLAALGVGPERIVFHDLDGVSLFSRLIVPSWPTPAKLAPSAGVYDVYRRLRPQRAPAERPRLYLTRKNVASRPMLNEDDVRALFERRGFQAVDPGGLSFAETRELFASPACVAGPFGSAFHNLAFSAGKPVSLVLLPDHTRHHLDEIALWHGDLGLRFGYLWGQGLPGRSPKDRHAPWIAPLDRLDRAIDTMLELALRAA
jgi:tetratricopeptide (TPR) repeat protein